MNQPQLVFRPSLPSDKADVMEFVKGIWNGNDYLPYVWDDWMADPRGQLYSAVYGDKVVSVARLAQVTSDQWWLEGLRVDPAFQGQKIGSRMHEWLMQEWFARGNGTVRLWTNATRATVQHLCDRLGFVKTQERKVYAAEALHDTDNAFTLVGQQDMPAALAFIHQHAQTSGALMDLVWRLAAPSLEALNGLHHIKGGRMLWWRQREGLLCVWDEFDDDETIIYPMVSIAAAAPQDMPALLRDARHYAAHIGAPKVSWHAPLLPHLVDAFEEAGYATTWDTSNYQYERAHPTRP